MRLVVLTREERDYSSQVRQWVREMERMLERSQELEVYSPDERDGAGLARAYDIMDFPAILVLTDEGRIVRSDVGLPLPSTDYVKNALAA
jgi:hypothetical protein